MSNGINYSRISLGNIFNYFIIIAFLFPRGYAEFNLVYKNIFTYFTWGATILIWFQLLLVHNKELTRKNTFLIMTYFIITIITTILIRGVKINGFQKLFAYPSIFLFIICKMKENPKRILNIINNVMLILFVLNQFILRSFFSQQYHITFLGHVQMISQLGVLAIFCALIYWMLYHNKKKRTIFLVLISLFTMITTDASSAVLSAIILCIFGILYKFGIYRFLTCDTKKYVIRGIVLSIVVVCLSVVNNLIYNNVISFFDFSGRSFVWRDALFKIKSKIWLGYGIGGTLLSVFWNQWFNSVGFDYAHNQILQNLLDGGIVGFIAFWYMVLFCCKNIKNIKNQKYRVLVNAILIIFSIIMIFESTSFYCYMFMFLAIVYVLPNITDKVDKEMV